jgi:hypothetical protein
LANDLELGEAGCAFADAVSSAALLALLAVFVADASSWFGTHAKPHILEGCSETITLVRKTKTLKYPIYHGTIERVMSQCSLKPKCICINTLTTVPTHTTELYEAPNIMVQALGWKKILLTPYVSHMLSTK